MRKHPKATCALSHSALEYSGTTNSGKKKGGPAARVTAKPSSHSAAKIELRKLPRRAVRPPAAPNGGTKGGGSARFAAQRSVA